MNTDQLIAELSRDVPRVRPGAIGRRIATGLVLGLIVSGTMGVFVSMARRMKPSPKSVSW